MKSSAICSIANENKQEVRKMKMMRITRIGGLASTTLEVFSSSTIHFSLFIAYTAFKTILNN
jgi:phosphatidylserine decarboxylase